MKKWGLLITLYYVIVVLLLLMPMFMLLCDSSIRTVNGYLRLIFDYYTDWAWTIPAFIVVGGQVLLLALSVDTSFRRNKPRAHIFVSIALVGFFLMILGIATVSSLFVAIRGDKVGDYFDAHHLAFFSYLILWPVLWIIWGTVFYLRTRGADNPFSRAVSWLIKGSVLELLVAVPCHVIVRRRDDCSAPIVTSFGICSGIAIMLLAFGPSVYLLYKNRLASYPSHSSPQSQ
jgi:hypothetical protein